MRTVTKYARHLIAAVSFLASSASFAADDANIIVCDDGLIYNRTADGSLKWYKHINQKTGDDAWANAGSGVEVGNGWGSYRKILCAAPGILYAIDNKGNLVWYNHVGHRSGNQDWANSGNGVVVGNGWGDYDSIFQGGDGVIYALKRNGELYWYRHNGWKAGNQDWANGGKGVVVGNGWNSYESLLSFKGGIIYGVKSNGDLLWYRHNGWKTGSQDWANNGTGKPVGNGWDIYNKIFSASNGSIYAISHKKVLYYYKHQGWSEGDMNWSNGGNGVVVKRAW